MSFKSLSAALSVVSIIALTSTSANADIFAWLSGKQPTIIPVYEDGKTKTTAMKPTSVGQSVWSPLTPWKPYRTVTDYKPVTQYKPHWVKVPITLYRPNLDLTEKPGQTTLLKPYETNMYQLRMVPMTNYRPVLDDDKGFLGININAIDVLLSPIMPNGCLGCQKVDDDGKVGTQYYNPGNAAADSTDSSAADQKPNLDPNELQQPDISDQRESLKPIVPAEETSDDTSSTGDATTSDDSGETTESPAEESEGSSVLKKPEIETPKTPEATAEEASEAKPEPSAEDPNKPIPDPEGQKEEDEKTNAELKQPELSNPLDRTAIRLYDSNGKETVVRPVKRTIIFDDEGWEKVK